MHNSTKYLRLSAALLVVLHNLHIDEVDDEIKHLALLVHYFNVQIHVYIFNDVFSVNQ